MLPNADKLRAEFQFRAHVVFREPSEGSLHGLLAALRADVLNLPEEGCLKGIPGSSRRI